MEELPKDKALLSPALCVASREKDTPMVKKLIEAGADVNFRDDCGFSPLLMAAYSRSETNSNIDIMKILLEAGADVNVAAEGEHGEPTTCWTPLMVAVGKGDMEMFSLLMASGADVNYQNGAGETALSGALAFPYMDSAEGIVRALIQAGADLNTIHRTTKKDVEDRGWSPLMLAIASGHEDMVKMLIDAGADLNYRNPSGQTALVMAFRYGRIAREIIKPLVDAGADVNVSGDWNERAFTPLMYAAMEKEEEICKVLIAAGAEIGKISLEGWKDGEEKINDFLTRLQQEGKHDE